MVISTISTLALYCSRCGKAQIHDISRFALKNELGRGLFCSCGQYQATISGSGHSQYLLEVPCVVCETKHIICVDIKEFWRQGVNKIYCSTANLELGFSGNRGAIEQTIAEHQRQFASIVREVAQEDEGDNSQILFEILNKIHDMAERGQVFCQCGGAIEAAVHIHQVELVCIQCGGRRIIPAANEADGLLLEELTTIKINSGRRSRYRR
jgi:hypothetical protein